MKYKIQLVLAIIALVLFLCIHITRACESPNPEIIVVQEIMAPQTYFGPATIAPHYARLALRALPPAFQLYGIPTRPLRELGGWRVNYGI